MKLTFVFYSKNSIDSINERLTELIRNRSFFYSAYYGWVEKSEFYLRKRALPKTGFIVKIRGNISLSETTNKTETRNKMELVVTPGWDFYVAGLLILTIINANVVNGYLMNLKEIMIALGYNLLGLACWVFAMWISVNIALQPIREIVSNKSD
jgi:hypothetical protein